ncbi:MAG: glycosyltransferase [candidate division Zixibacteria bacterium]|nr:glycosyltransferase [candidate division Zixibacteria bacterium]
MSAKSARIDISVIVPVYNEREGIKESLSRICAALDSHWSHWEVLVVDDGSTDATGDLVNQYSRIEPKVRLVSYRPNQGRGKALRTGFANARGKIICTTDADLSYHESHLVRMAQMLEADSSLDLVIGSPYMPGGSTENVPWLRLAISRLGNKVLGYAMRGDLSTVTGILRAYRSDCIKSLELESVGKEINLEILSKAIAMGFRAKEMPSTLRGRSKGRSKFKFKSTAFSHLIFSLYEKPVMLFGLIGLFLVAVGLAGGLYIVLLWLKSSLNPERPLMTLTVILLVTGVQILLFGFLGTQMVFLRKEIYKIQRQNKFQELWMEQSESPANQKSSVRRITHSKGAND